MSRIIERAEIAAQIAAAEVCLKLAKAELRTDNFTDARLAACEAMAYLAYIVKQEGKRAA